MAPTLKRSLSTTTRSISPPAVRRKFSPSTEHVATSRPAADSLRIFSWNVNGIGPLLQKQLSFSPATPSPLRAFLKRHQWPHFLCLQEVKINPKDNASQRHLQHAADQGHTPEEPTYSIHFALPRDKYNATGFGGKVHGVASLIRNDIVPRICVTRRPDWDLEGRVLIHEMDKGLAIVNGYWVNGTSNPHRDPENGCVTGTRHDYKLRFHQWMLEEALRLESEGYHVVLIGDMNVARARIDGHPN